MCQAEGAVTTEVHHKQVTSSGKVTNELSVELRLSLAFSLDSLTALLFKNIALTSAFR